MFSWQSELNSDLIFTYVSVYFVSVDVPEQVAVVER